MLVVADNEIYDKGDLYMDTKKEFDVDEFFTKKLEEVKKQGLGGQSFQSTINTKDWAVVLGFKSGSTPWKKGIFNGAKSKLIARIATVTDQELLRFLIKETDYEEVKYAAAKKVTDQKLMEHLALHDNSADVRLIAVQQINNSDVLRKVAQSDLNNTVRSEAFYRVATPADIKQRIMNSKNDKDKAGIKYISNSTDRMDIALSARNVRIRAAAAAYFPAESAEGKLLQSAATLSEKITAVELYKFDDAYGELQRTKPQLLQKMATVYPDNCVRYLARGRKDLEYKAASTMEEQLSAMTPSWAEARKKEEIQKGFHMVHRAQQEVQEFIKLCKAKTQTGYHSAEKICHSFIDYAVPFEQSQEAEILAEVLNLELKKQKFVNAKAHSDYNWKTRREWHAEKGIYAGYYEEKREMDGYIVKISASW